MSEKEEGWSATARTALIALPILYVLSIGPVAYSYSTGHINPGLNPAISAFYKPLDLLYDHTALQKPLDVYVRWWRECGGVHSGKP